MKSGWRKKKAARWAFWAVTERMWEMLFVEPEYFGRGVGKALLRHARDLHGALSLEVNEQNARALAFYQRQGFAVTGRSALDNAGRPYPLLYLAWRG